VLTPEDLVEYEAIKRLKYRYVRCLDQKNWVELASCFTPDATASYGDGKYSFAGLDAIMAFLRDSLGAASMITMHQVHQPEIDLAPDRRSATATWALEDRVIMTEYKLTLRGAAYYSDRYVKEDGRWLIADTGYQRLFEEMEPRSEAITLG
jgi:uncharacterized protein (TIGR02246 family)